MQFNIQFNLKKSLDLDLKNTRTTLLNSNLFYDILELNLRSTWTTLWIMAVIIF